MIKKLLLALVTLAAGAFAQSGAVLGDAVIGPTGVPMRHATVYVCQFGATGNPCNNQQPVFSDAGLTLPITQPFYTDALGSYTVWLTPGTYFAQVTAPGQPTVTRYYTIGSAGAGLSSANSFTLLQTFGAGITGTGNIGGLQLGTGALNNPFTWLGKQTFAGGITSNSVAATVDVNTYSGSDIGAKIGAAITALAGNPCQLKVTVPGTISTWPDVPMGCTIDFVPGLYTLSTHVLLNHKDVTLDFHGSMIAYTLDDGDYAFKIGKRAGYIPTTATFTNTSNIVTATGGTDFSDIDSGDQLDTSAGGYNVQSKNSSTQVTITVNYSGTTQSYSTGAYLDPTAYVGPNFHPVTLKNFSMYYTGAGTSAVGGISVRLTTKPILQNVRMFGFNGTGYALNLFGAIDGEYSGVGASYGRNGVWLDGGSYVGQNWGTNVSRFDSLFLVGNTGNPLVVDNFTSSALFSECHLEGNPATVAVVLQNTINNVKFDTCYFERNGDGTTSSADMTINGSGVDQVQIINTTHNSSVANVPASGILVSGATNVIISGMKVTSSAYSTCYNYISGATGQTISNNCNGVAWGDPNQPTSNTTFSAKVINGTAVNGGTIAATTSIASGAGQSIANTGDVEVNVGTYTSGASPWTVSIPHKYGLTSGSHCQAYAADTTSAAYTGVSNTPGTDSIVFTYTGTSGHPVRFICSAN